MRNVADEALDEALDLVTARPTPPAGVLLLLLRESAPHFQGRGTGEAERLRAYLMVAIAAAGHAAAVLPLALGDLATGESAATLAAAARTLRLAGEVPAGAVAALRRAADRLSGRDEFVDLDHYPPRTASETTALGELVQALFACGRQADADVAALRQMAGEHGGFDPTVAKLLAGEPPSCCSVARASTAVADDPHPLARTLAPVLGVEVEDQGGVRRTLGEVICGRPSLIAFFYTRCMNPLKCTRTITRLADLRRRLDADGTEALVAGISYDPAFDLPDRLARYGRDRGMRFAPDCLLLRTTGAFAPIAEHLSLGVGYGDSTVNFHRIEWLISDASGTVVHSDTRSHWNEGALTDTLAELAKR